MAPETLNIEKRFYVSTLVPGHAVVVVAAEVAVEGGRPLHVLHPPEEPVQVASRHPRLAHLKIPGFAWLSRDILASDWSTVLTRSPLAKNPLAASACLNTLISPAQPNTPWCLDLSCSSILVLFSGCWRLGKVTLGMRWIRSLSFLPS